MDTNPFGPPSNPSKYLEPLSHLWHVNRYTYAPDAGLAILGYQNSYDTGGYIVDTSPNNLIATIEQTL